VKDEPIRASVCHCRNCQQRNGSAFGIGAYFREGDVEIEGNAVSVLSAAPSLSWTAEALPGIRAVAGGTFDEPEDF
jgi:hypothetical protein